MKDMLDKTAAIATVVGLVVALIALSVAYKEYSDAKENSRITATLGYLTRYKSDLLLSMTQRFNSFLDGPEPQQLIANPGDPAANWATKTVSLTKKANMVIVIRTMTDFFDELYICVARSICDLDLTLRLLAVDLQTFYVWNADLLDELNKGAYGPKLGCGLHALYQAVLPQLDAHRANKPTPAPTLDLKACET
jgi:hypothetical protein